MPPRKSDSSKVATGDEGSVVGTTAGTSIGASTAARKDDGVNIEDLNLPKSIVTRLAKGVLPPNTQIQGNAMLALSKGATVFVNYLATHANEYAQNANRKTIAPADVFKALEDIEFDFKDRLEAELAKFNEIQTDKRNTYRKKVAADKASGAKNGSHLESDKNGISAGADGGGEPVAKKPRIDTDADLGAANEVEDASDLLDEGDLGEEIVEEGEDDQDVDDMEDDEAAEEVDEPPEDALEEPEERDVGDEALDNGGDSD